MIEDGFWSTVESYTKSLWWFGEPALVALAGALLVSLLALVWLRQRSGPSVALTAAALGGSVALLAPGAALAWQPLQVLGLDDRRLAYVPTASFAAIGQTFDHALQMSYWGAALGLAGMLGIAGLFGTRRGRLCATCGRERHPRWKGVCPECQLMQIAGANGPPLSAAIANGDVAPLTEFGQPTRTELLDSAQDENAWVEVVRAPSGVGERFALAARLTIGRDFNQCRLVLDDESVSGRHAYIERDHNRFVIYDWGSRNGVFVNGNLVAQQELRDGDLVRVGRVELCFHAPTVQDDTTPTLLFDSEPAGARLVLVDGLIESTTFPLRQLDIRIGRGRQNDIVLDRPTVSRSHASIQFDGLDYYLVDGGASNGTWLDDTRVFEKTRLCSGQIIRLGNQVLRFESEEAADVATLYRSHAVSGGAGIIAP